jgi:hypothetical protein
MRNGTAGLSTPPRKSDSVNTSREPLVPPRSKSQLRKIHIGKKDATSVSETPDQHSDSGNRWRHTLKQHEDSYKVAYEASLASGREAGYQRGYREGFSDGYKLSNSAVGSTSTLSGTATGEARKVAVNRASRLRGFPCTNCGCAMYSDEAKCPHCGTPKATAVEKPTEPS